MTTETLSVPDISCDHCKVSIEGAVTELTGVERVEVNIDDRVVDVAYRSDQVSRSQIVAAIEDQGYEVVAG